MKVIVLLEENFNLKLGLTPVQPGAYTKMHENIYSCKSSKENNVNIFILNKDLSDIF